MVTPTDLSILIVDDHQLVRAGMRVLLDENSQVASVEEASSAEEALELVTHTVYDVILMDINLPGMSGVEAADKLLSIVPQTRIIMITGSLEDGHIRTLLNSGVRGYITKGSDAEEVDKAVCRVMNGEQYLSPDVAQKLALGVIRGDEKNPFEKLTARESEITQMLLRGQRNRQISTALYISEKTVSTHRTRAFDKLGVKTTAELVRLAIRHDLWN